ncbi:MAG: hypothetical protein JWP11_3404 [Frankiales bacterium]|nr:hypothetical protein [Frankiales bacterium]
MTAASRGRIIVVPVDLALVFTADGGWRYEQAPPRWWLDEAEALLEADERPRGVLRLVRPPRQPVTACRPGSGPCRRRHEHASARRDDACR